jgi:hypothetical protein
MAKKQEAAPTKNYPSHGVFVVEGEGDRAYWIKIGCACWTDIKQLSADDQEATAMLDGILKLRKSLAASGFAPR